MSMDENNDTSDGSNTFWPGYVDAVTNLVLNLLFLLTIMTVAVFMFALELGRASLGGSGKTPVPAAKSVQGKAALDPVKDKSEMVAALNKENAALKREIQLLNQRVTPNGSPAKVVTASAPLPQPKKGVEIIMGVDGEVIVRFTDDAVGMTPPEHDKLRDALKAIFASGSSRITVVVPNGFSEAKRMGFYRAMAVRNLLVEMKMPQDRIDVSVHEGGAAANASLVRVKAQ